MNSVILPTPRRVIVGRWSFDPISRRPTAIWVTALQDLGRLDDAVLSYCQALEINQDYQEAHFNLGSALQNLGQFDAAAASYRRALEINPDFGTAQSNLLFMHNYLADQEPQTLLAEARRFGKLAAKQARPFRAWRNAPEADRCLRVGLVSGDLRNHPVGYFAEGVLASLSQQASGRLELFAYPSHFCADAVAERIKASCSRVAFACRRFRRNGCAVHTGRQYRYSDRSFRPYGPQPTASVRVETSAGAG